MTNPIAIAAKGKGYKALVKRAGAIGSRYGLTSAPMDKALQLFADVLQPYQCGATFPITAVTLARNGPVIAKYQAQNIEFAMHGLVHIDHSQLSLAQQTEQIKRAAEIFERKKVTLAGFRCPYLRWNEDTPAAISANGLLYDSSQALYYDVPQSYGNEDYRRVLGFYGAKSALVYPALPKLTGGMVQIPYSVPDDEALIERFQLTGQPAVMSQIWQAILAQTHQQGELFTLGLHPERIGFLRQPLADTLAQAHSLFPHVWMARLDEIARWWMARRETTFTAQSAGNNRYHLTVSGPAGLAVLGRHISIETRTEPWTGGFERIFSTKFQFQAEKRPCIGVSSAAPVTVSEFLRQQGFWVEVNDQPAGYAIYLNQIQFSPEDERPLLAQLAQNDAPLICAGRWPDGAQSALSVTGDIDAVTLWDYLLRLSGK